MPKKNVSINPYLSEYVYDLLWNMTPETKKTVSRKYWKYLRNSKMARSFSDYSTLEEKMLLFSELGIEHAIVFSQHKFSNTNSLKKVLAMYQADKNAGAVQEISKLRVFVSSDKDLTFLLSIMSQTIHTKLYYMNQQLNKTAYHITEWNKNETTGGGRELRQTIEDCGVIDRTLMNCAINLDFTKNLYGFMPMDLKVLMYLFQHRQAYVPKESVWAFFAWYGKTKITTCLKRLKAKEYIMSHPNDIHPKYTISQQGVKMVCDFRDTVLKANEF